MATTYRTYESGDRITLGKYYNNTLILVVGETIVGSEIVVKGFRHAVKVPITQAVELFIAGENEKPEVQALINCLQDNIFEYQQIEFIRKYSQSTRSWR